MSKTTRQGKSERDHVRDKRVGTNSLGLRGSKAKRKFYQSKKRKSPNANQAKI